MKSDTSDLETLYRILNINVNHLSSIPPSFSSNTQESSLSPVPVSEKDAPLEKDNTRASSVKKSVRFGTYDDTSVIAYDSHPLIDLATMTDVRNKCSGCDNRMCDDCSGSRAKWSAVTHLYIGSITVIGLYAIFRAIQRSN